MNIFLKTTKIFINLLLYHIDATIFCVLTQKNNRLLQSVHQNILSCIILYIIYYTFISLIQINFVKLKQSIFFGEKHYELWKIIFCDIAHFAKITWLWLASSNGIHIHVYWIKCLNLKLETPIFRWSVVLIKQ